MISKEGLTEIAYRESYQAIVGSADKMRKVDGHMPAEAIDRKSSLSELAAFGIKLPLSDGSEISIKQPALDDYGDRTRRWVEIGGARFKVTPEEFFLSHIKLPFQVQIDLVGESIATVAWIGMKLNFSQQKSIINWINTSIERRKLGESPFKISFSSQGQKPKS